MTHAASPITRRLAVAAAALALVSTSTFVGRAEAQSKRRVLFSNFSSCPKFLAYVQSLALPLVGPYGLGGPQVLEDAVPVPVRPLPRTSGTTKKSTTPTLASPATVPAAPAPAPAAASAPRAGAPETAAPATAAPVVSAEPAEAVEQAAGRTSGGTSTTNVQEAGVDEGDEVETDGRYVYTAIGQGGVRIIDTTTGAVVASLPAYGQGNEPQLILDGTRLAVTRNLYDQYGPETVVELWSVLDPTQPKLIGRTHLEGQALAVRSVNSRVRIVLTTAFGQRLRFAAGPDGFATQKSLDAATALNKRVVRSAKANDWLPRIYDESASGQTSPVRPALDCREMGKPADPSGLGVVWVATVDLDTTANRRVARGSGGVVTNGGTAYSSASTLVVSTVDYDAQPIGTDAGGRPINRRGVVVRPQSLKTALHAFDLSPADGATYLASGEVPGTLLNQFSMSEYQGVLRVATTTQNQGFGTRQESGVHLLVRNGRAYNEISAVTGLGRNEQIYGVRFIGDMGYVVTFRQTDPLYVLDLRNPRAPRLAGELKIPGYSAYLHPIDPGYILGVGQDATDQGRRLGTMLQVFDVRNPDNPQQVAKLRVGGQSEAEYNHHAFLWWAPTRNAFIPTNDWGNGQPNSVFSGLVVANVALNSITEKGRLSHEVPFNNGGPGVVFAPTVPPQPGVQPGPIKAFDQIRRALIVNGRLVTIGYSSARVSALDTLTQQRFVTY